MLKLPHKIFILITIIATITLFFNAFSSYFTSKIILSREIEKKLSMLCKISVQMIDGDLVEAFLHKGDIKALKEKHYKTLEAIKKHTGAKRGLLLSKSRRIIADTDNESTGKLLKITDSELYEIYRALEGDFTASSIYRTSDGTSYCSAYGR